MEAAAVLALCTLAFPHPLHARVLRADEDGFAECSVFFKEQSPQDRAPCYQTLTTTGPRVVIWLQTRH
ncbi:hypothetical protein NDU88_005979 [Pleurodeles waltl]|uniref:Uncharacterized protein n=1 Tax=Pleurodeles waltl TaxID=8319 RepID=A0AAV7RMM8_PLEWA|nr:hypothetical protein NDU88_005979 [Pleurodeles waltl]